ncbi:MAG: YdcF family protein [Terriglobia bacterium]
MITRDAITQLLFLRHESAPVDLALVLGSPSISNMDPAIVLYKTGLTQRIVITGRGPVDEGEPEWRVYQRYAVKAEIPGEAIIIEREARSTLENFVLTEVILAREIGWERIRSIAICTKPFHTRRAYMTARRFFPGHVELLMIPPEDPGDIHATDWWQTALGRERVLHELRRIGDYALKGDLAYV